MMSKNFDKKFTLPQIEGKVQKKDDSENYNFVKESKKTRNSFKEIPVSSDEVSAFFSEME